MNQVRMHVGVDIGKGTLDVCYPDGKKEKVKNNKSCRAKIIRKAIKLGAIVSFEATGPYDEALAQECLAKGAKAVRLDAWKARKYAESQGRIEKTDAIDCEMIRDYAASLKESALPFLRQQSEAQKRLKENVSVRKNLMKARSIIYNQYESVTSSELRKCLDRTLAKLDKEIAHVEEECDKSIESDMRMSELSRRFLEVKGVGKNLVRTVLAYCPEIGEFTDKGIAKMFGLAPIDHESCTIKSKSVTKRGCVIPRIATYMAAVSACRSNHILKENYRRLVAAGKPKRIALTAVARRLIVLLNKIAKHPDFTPAKDPKDIAKAVTKKSGRGRPKSAV